MKYPVAIVRLLRHHSVDKAGKGSTRQTETRKEEKDMKKAKILKIPARGDWEFAEVETEGKGQLALKTMQTLVGG